MSDRRTKEDLLDCIDKHLNGDADECCHDDTDSLGERISQLTDKELSHLFRTISEQSNGIDYKSVKHAKVGNKAKLRKRAGAWYSAMIFGDLLSFEFGKSAEEQVEQRMHALLHESLFWIPKPLVAQVLLNDQNNSEPLICRTAVPCDGCIRVKSFIENLEEYVHTYGSSVQLTLHHRKRARWINSQRRHSVSDSVKSSVSWSPVRYQNEGLSIDSEPHRIQVPTNKKIKQAQEETFFEDVVRASMDNAENPTDFCMMHLSAGVNTDSTSCVAHLYVICGGFSGSTCMKGDKHQSSEDRCLAGGLPSHYESAMNSLLHKLVNFYVVRKVQENQHSLKKKAQMLHLLTQPLAKLSDALDQTQQHSQKLRTLLYDPSRSIFSIAPRVLRFFEQNRTIQLGGVSWETLHSPGKANPGNTRELKLTLAAIICEVFGQIDPMPENDGALITRARTLLESNDSRLPGLSSVCCEIVGDNCFDDFSTLQRAVGYLKEILYRPLKDGGLDFPLHPLLVILFTANPRTRVFLEENELANMRDGLKRANLFGPLFVNTGLPSPRYSQWLAMVQGLIAYAKVEKDASVKTAKVSVEPGTKLEVTFEEDVFERDVERLYKKMKEWVGNKEATYTAYGNFMKPFIDFSQTVQGKVVESSECFKLHFDAPAGDKEASATIRVYEDTFICEIKILESQ